jgi:hypothetical protein
MTRVFSVIPLLFLFSGCTHVAQPAAPPHSEIRQIHQKNYILGDKKIAYIGEPIVLVKEYRVLESESSLKADNPFTITGGLSSATVNVFGTKGQEFPIVGSIKVNGKHCNTIAIPSSIFVFAIKPDGAFSGVVAGFDWGMSPVQGVNVYKINPPNTRFYPTKVQHVMKDAPFTNMELIYSGLSDNALQLLYREYTSDDLIRPAYTQELSYPPDAQVIRFKAFKIEITEASAEKLVYSVMEE